MAESLDRGNFDKILSNKDMEDEKTRDRFWKKLSVDDLKEKKLINILRMFKVVKIISQCDN